MNITNKITGRDISTEYLGLMMGLITKHEFELITLTPTSCNCNSINCEYDK